MIDTKLNKKSASSNNKNIKKEKLYLDPLKMLYMWPGVLNIKTKARKIVRKNRKDPDTYPEEYRYHWSKKSATKLLKAMNITLQVEGIENWLDRGVVLAPNHQSSIDPLLFLAINDFEKQQPLAFIAKEELFVNKKTKDFMNIIDIVPLNRESPRSALTAFKEARDLVVNFKRSLVIFPEGTRSGKEEIGEFLPTSLKIAQMSNAPVVPVTIIGSHEAVNPKRSRNVVVKVIFGKPIYPNVHLTMPTEKLTQLVHKNVLQNQKEWMNKQPTYTLKVLKKSKKGNKGMQKSNEEKKTKRKKTWKDIFKIT